MDSMSKSHVLQSSIHVLWEAYFLLSLSEQSIMITSSFAYHLHSLAFTLCTEKDTMTVALRTFANAYSKTITMSNVTTVSLMSFILWPWGHPLRFYNRQRLGPLTIVLRRP